MKDLFSGVRNVHTWQLRLGMSICTLAQNVNLFLGSVCRFALTLSKSGVTEIDIYISLVTSQIYVRKIRLVTLGSILGFSTYNGVI